MSIVIAGAVTLPQSHSEIIEQGVKTSIPPPEDKRLLIPPQNTYESHIAQELKNIQISSTLRSPVQALQLAAKLPGAFARTNHPSIVIRTQRSNITIFPQLNENETHHIFSTNMKSLNSAYNRILNGTTTTNRFSL